MIDKIRISQPPETPPTREYHPYKKHKGHDPKGTRCPEGYATEDMQRLLESAIPQGINERLLYNIYFMGDIPAGIVKFKREFNPKYHGYPETANRIPPTIFDELCRINEISPHEKRRLLRGR
jgi:hypothetical protein